MEKPLTSFSVDLQRARFCKLSWPSAPATGLLP